MKKITTICSVVLGILLFAPANEAKEWRGIIPLHSSRDDVHKLLGKPKSQSALSDHYRPNDEEYVNIEYATKPCLGLTYYWGNYAVAKNTVLTISVSYEHGFPLSSLNISNIDALKREVDHSLTVYYFDADQGVEYSVQDGTVVSIEYGPGKIDSYLRCPDKSLLFYSPPNKSLDASGGRVFRIMTGAAMLD